MSVQRHNIRIVAENTQYIAVFGAYHNVGTVRSGAEYLHLSADILLDVPQFVFAACCPDGLSVVMTDKRQVVTAENDLRTKFFTQSCGIEIMVNMGMSEKNVPYIEAVQPFAEMGIGQVKSRIYEHIAVFAVENIAGDRTSAHVHTYIIDVSDRKR